MAELKPTKDYVLVEPEDRQARKTKSGILLNDPKYEGPPIAGIVHSVGENIKSGIKPGDRVLFKNPEPRGFKFEKKGYFALENDQIIAIINKEDELWG